MSSFKIVLLQAMVKKKNKNGRKTHNAGLHQEIRIKEENNRKKIIVSHVVRHCAEFSIRLDKFIDSFQKCFPLATFRREQIANIPASFSTPEG
jgi:hypothetical protein